MTERDFGTFDRAFGRVCGAFRVRLTVAERQELTRTYFRVLDRYDLTEVLDSGKRCLERFKKFPTIADWVDELEAATHVVPVSHQAARQMTVTEIDEHTRAESLRYADAPCGCAACCAAHVDDRPLRFVPTLVNGTEDRAYHPHHKRLEVVGHWAHGEELKRWYDAREKFFAQARRRPVGRAVLALVTREPGEDD